MSPLEFHREAGKLENVLLKQTKNNLEYRDGVMRFLHPYFLQERNGEKTTGSNVVSKSDTLPYHHLIFTEQLVNLKIF
jgi:hypothetical protein